MAVTLTSIPGGATDEAEPSIEDIVATLPRRLHEVMDPYIAATPERIALIEDGATWSYLDLDNMFARSPRTLPPSTSGRATG